MNAPNGSEGTRDALPPASPVPERSNVKPAPLESEDGQRLAGRACSHCISEYTVPLLTDENGQRYILHPVNGRKIMEAESRGQYIRFERRDLRMDVSNQPHHGSDKKA